MAKRTIRKPDLVFNELERRLLEQVWKVGDQIPTEEILATEFKCSRSTISKAISRLEHAGVVKRQTRNGTHVIGNKPKSTQSPLNLDACAFVYPSDQHEGVWRTLRGFQGAAHDLDRRAISISTGANLDKEQEIIARLGELDVKGAVIFPMMVDPINHPQYNQMISSCRFPIVLVEVAIPETRRPAVIVDGFDAGYTMTRHLLTQGLKKIGFLANYGWIGTTREKHLGYRRAMSDAGVDPSQNSLLMPDMHPSYDDPLKEPREIATTYLQSHPDIEGVVCSSDFLAVGLFQAAESLCRRVPDELRIAGIDDFALATSLGITTYHIPYEEMGRRAFETLHHLMTGASTADDIYLRGELVIRQTT